MQPFAAIFLFLLMLVAGMSAAAQPPHDLYRVLTQAAHTGWTPDLRRAAADIYLQLNDPAAALAHWEAVLLAEPDDRALMRRTAEMYVQRGEWPQAQAAIERLLAALPDDGWGNLQLGLLLAPDHPAEALSALRRAEQHGQTPPAGLIALLDAPRDSIYSLALEVGTMLAEARLYAHAEHAFARAGERIIGRGEALALVALMRGLQGKDGQRWLDEARAVAPRSPQVHSAAGFYYRAVGDTFLSLDSFAAAVSHAPLDPELYAELGRSYDLIGDAHTALFWYGQAARLAPDDARYQRLHRAATDLLGQP